MKTIMRIGAVFLIAALPASVRANQGPTEAKPGQRWTGTITSVDTRDKTLTGEHWHFDKSFKIGEKCAISTVDNKQGALGDLRPGEEVRVNYQDAEGVLVANRIAEKALRYDGTVQTVNKNTGTITMEEAPVYQPFHAPEQFRIAGDCKVILWNGHDGTLANVQPGDRISVVYELPGGAQLAYRLREKTTTFEGVAEAINPSAHTLKAKAGSGEKQFSLADHCQVILGGERKGHLKDLVPGQKYLFTYEPVNGINVLDRIAPVQAAKSAETASLK